MVKWTRSARIAPRKFVQGVQWAKEIPEFVNKNIRSKGAFKWIVLGNWTDTLVH